MNPAPQSSSESQHVKPRKSAPKSGVKRKTNLKPRSKPQTGPSQASTNHADSSADDDDESVRSAEQEKQKERRERKILEDFYKLLDDFCGYRGGHRSGYRHTLRSEEEKLDQALANRRPDDHTAVLMRVKEIKALASAYWPLLEEFGQQNKFMRGSPDERHFEGEKKRMENLASKLAEILDPKSQSEG